ncbi:hypothetical protein D9Q98_006488 [Chlorella vulgaris]|uniref:Uncharacterized protein n=1 Tax=Chlorella vulgaris TaxID=3077 RepID=A0A9D4TKI6_CHLVU|nr:hypothetical protein D9Q98_006488 [Chlorella vulgaris]
MLYEATTVWKAGSLVRWRQGWCGHSKPRRSVTVCPRAAVVGIDLGTSNSAVSVVENGTPRVLQNAQGNAAIPSIVGIAQDGKMLVGQAVLDPPEGYATPYSRSQPGDSQPSVVRVLPTDCFHSFKRLMGKSAEEVERDASRLGFSVGQGDRGEAAVYSPVLDDMLTPEELSGWVLQHLKQLAEEQLGEAVTGAVVTVPAHFQQAQQGGTHAAATQAGIPQVQLLQEPVAAALAYGINGGTDGDTVLVFDVGGGTFDISILQAFEGIMEVLGTAGDASLGGNDIDARLADWLLQEAAARGPLPVDAKAWAMAAAEAAKIALATADSAEVALPGGGAPIVLTTECFEELTAGLFQLMANVLEALGEALFVEWAVKPSLAVPGRAAASSTSNGSSTNSGSSSPSSNGSADTSEAGSSRAEGSGSSSGKDRWAPPPRRITQVALVGQVTRLPSVQRFVHRVTGVRPQMGVDPAEAVALGAAIHAGVLLGQVNGVELMDGSYSQDLHSRATGFSGWQP